MSVPVKKGGKGKAEKTPPAPVAGETHPLVNLRKEIDSLFDNFLDTSWMSPFSRHGFLLRPFGAFDRALAGMGKITPRVDITETDRAFQLSAELPGMDEKDVEVTLTDTSIRVKGEKKTERNEKQGDVHIMERSYGSFERSFPVPESVDADKVTAEFDKGVLTVILPKKKMAQKPARSVKVTKK